MQDDELQELWNRMDAKLDRCLHLNEERLRAEVLGRARGSLFRHRAFRFAELAIGVLLLVLLGQFLSARVAEPRWLLAGGVLHVFVAGIVGFGLYQLVLLSKLDHGAPVTTLQRALERIAIVEYRAFKWAFLGGVLLWVLVPLVLCEGLFEIDLIGELSSAWLGANLGLGIALAWLGQAWSRRYVEAPDASPRWRRFAEHLSGRSLIEARAHLNELAEFERAR